MSKIYSTTVVDINGNKQLECSFTISRGSETIVILDEMLTNLTVAQARAESIFLDQSYVSKKISLSTYHIDAVYIGDIISVNSVLYKIIDIVDVIVGAKATINIVGERWQ